MNDAELILLRQRVEKLEKNGIPGVRDFFATSAMSALGKVGFSMQPQTVAKLAYEIADAMMEERAK